MLEELAKPEMNKREERKYLTFKHRLLKSQKEFSFIKELAKNNYLCDSA